MSSILRSSKFVRYFVGLARNIVLSTPREIDGALVQRSQCLANTVSNNYATVAAHKQNNTLDKSIKRLDEDARKIGRISRKEIEEVLDEIRQSKKATSSQSLMVIRCCGNLVPEEAPELRTQLVKQVWNTLEKLGVPMDISHYNALLRVYLENEHRFSPTQFLAELEAKGVEPNRVTFQRLIAGFCQVGDIEGATRILEFMRERQLPVSESVFNALILGHSQADDMESAHGILGVMKQAGLEPSNESYTTLMCGYAKKGDITAIEKLIEESETKELFLSDRDILEVVYTLGVNKHSDLVDKILPKVKFMLGYNQDCANVILRLINKGDDETAMKVFRTMKTPAGLNGQPVYAGSFMIRQMVKCNMPVEKVVAFCKQLRQEGLNSLSFTIAVQSTFTVNNVNQTLELLQALVKNNEPVRVHYLWPVLVGRGKAGDVKGMKSIISTMIKDLNIQPSSETLKDYILPYLKDQKPENILASFIEAGMKRGTSAAAIIGYLIAKNKLNEAATMALQNVDINFLQAFSIRALVNAYENTQDLESFVTLVRAFISSVNKERSLSQSVEEEEGGGEEMEIIGLKQEELVGKCLLHLAIIKSRSMAKVLQAFLDHGLAISNSSAQLIENSLGGENLTEEVSTLLAKLASGEMVSEPLKRQMVKSPISKSPLALEALKERLIATGDPVDGVLRQLLSLYSINKDMDSALKIKNEMEASKIELSLAHYAQLMDGYINLEQLDKAEEIYNEARAKDSEFRLDRIKAIKFANLLVQIDKVDEAIDVLKVNANTGSRDINYSLNSFSFRMLNSLAEKKNVQNVKRMLEALSDNNYIDISNVFLGSIIKAHLLNNDLEGALDEFERCCELYRATPWKNELMCKLIEAEDANNLQRLTDLSTQIHGEVNSLYDLVLAFVQCGRVRQARKILETPGLRSREDRINIASQRFQNDGLVAPLENLVEVTKDLGYVDRTSIYYQLLLSYKNSNNVDKALGLWTKMQEEDVPLTDEFLHTLGTFLQANGRDVPFAIPSTTNLRTDESGNLENQRKSRSKNREEFNKAVQDNQIDKALEAKGKLDASGEELNRTDISRLLEALLKEGRINEANRLVMSWLPGKLPSISVLKFFTNKLAQTGDIESFDQFGSRLNEAMQKAVSFENKRLNCLLATGKGLEELERWEKAIDSAETQEEIDTLCLKFPRGGILGVLDKHPECIPQYEKLMDKFSNKGFVGPANSLFIHYFNKSEIDKAKAVFDKYLRNVSRLMYQGVLSKARSSRNPEMVIKLKEIIKDSASITPGVLGHLYSNIISIYCFDNKFDDALAQLEEAINVCTIENISIATLNRLKTGLEANNQTFKYTIPAKSSGKSLNESSSSSSSDDEKKSTQRQ